ncbi:MAG: GntR family transcriptional regulator [Clostridia bacterium]
MIINLSNTSGVALYEQITQQIKNNILRGAIIAGESLPSIRNLAAEINVSVITVKRAYEDLERLGFIKAIPAKGYFVSSNNVENMRDIAISKLEKDLDKIILTAKAISLTKQDFIDIIDVLFDEL